MDILALYGLTVSRELQNKSNTNSWAEWDAGLWPLLSCIALSERTLVAKTLLVGLSQISTSWISEWTEVLKYWIKSLRPTEMCHLEECIYVGLNSWYLISTLEISLLHDMIHHSDIKAGDLWNKYWPFIQDFSFWVLTQSQTTQKQGIWHRKIGGRGLLSDWQVRFWGKKVTPTIFKRHR